jgi:biotin synthase
MSFIQELKEKVLGGYEITREEAIQLLSEDLQELCDAANEIR